MKKIFFKKNKGFTLIELMVATSIFMMVMLVAMGSLIVTSNSAKKSQTLNFTMDNLSFAIESMSRSLRMGTNYYCADSFSFGEDMGVSDCVLGAEGIAFKPVGLSSSRRMAYWVNGGTIQRCDTDPTVSCVDIVSPNIDIDTLKFFVNGTGDDDIQPSIYMILKGSVTIKEEVTSFAIQTMISQRTLE